MHTATPPKEFTIKPEDAATARFNEIKAIPAITLLEIMMLTAVNFIFFVATNIFFLFLWNKEAIMLLENFPF